MAEKTGRADLNAALERTVLKFGTGDEIEHLDEQLKSDEEVKEIVGGRIVGGQPEGNGVVVLTGSRVFTFFLDGDEPILRECPLETVTSVDVKKKIFGLSANIKIEGSSRTLYAEHLSGQDAKRISAAIRQEADAAGQEGALDAPKDSE